ncbi:acyltransferase [Bifidobacterium simiiventris]|uniref:acyltransferase n=1 Tax=Bifidobacterium simiiventris TaxID=2834434 RepID=UPI001C5A18E9|nr:acyltransferase [Bifidobacterium simiiventris]MBW3078683.1 acyltransferase [Bifidobacterium simiiventris]
MDLHKIYLAIRCIPKTLIFNFRYLPFKKAIKLPIIVSHRVSLQRMGGGIEITAPIRPNMIRIGFHENPAFNRRSYASWYNEGQVVFQGTAFFGNGSGIANTGVLTFGDNFQMSGNSRIVCKYDTTFGDDVLVGWDCLFLDGDAHKLYVEGTAEPSNASRPIVVGNHVWFGARCCVLKGVAVADGCVVAANSCLTKVFAETGCVIGGYPARVIKTNIRWTR